MSQQIINLGAEPGNLGDGDSLRGALSKAQHNFNELYVREFVNDPSLVDHADPSIPGTIASALESTYLQGGGSVVIGPGTYNCSQSLIVRTNVRLIGSGLGTMIDAQHGFDVISLESGQIGLAARPGVENITIKSPSFSASSAIKAVAQQAGGGYIQYVRIIGGSAASWALTMDGCNAFSVIGISCDGEGSGIRWSNQLDLNINFGDSLITGVDIVLKNSGTTGVLLEGNSNGVINNILLSRVEVQSRTVLQGTVGVNLNRASRISFVNVDIENVGTAVSNGPNSRVCTFVNTYALGCTFDYVEKTAVSGVTIIGGDGDFANNQRLPSRHLSLYAPTFSDYTGVRTGVRDIERYTDTFNPRILSLADSGSTIFTNGGANGSVTFVLPNAAFTKSLEYSFTVLESQELRIVPNNNSDNILGYDGSVNSTAGGGFIFSSTPGTTCTLHNVDNAFWIMESRIGTWQVSP